MWKQRIQESLKIVRLCHRDRKFFQERFQILFGRLLAKETAMIIKRFVFPGELCGEPVIGLGFAYPFARRLFHKELCLCAGSRCETALPLPAATGFHSAFAPGGPWGRVPASPCES